MRAASARRLITPHFIATHETSCRNTTLHSVTRHSTAKHNTSSRNTAFRTDPQIQSGSRAGLSTQEPALGGHARRASLFLRSLLCDPVEAQCDIGCAIVPSDHVPTETIIIVTRSSGSSAANTGVPGRLAPQLFAASPGTKNIRCGCQLVS